MVGRQEEAVPRRQEGHGLAETGTSAGDEGGAALEQIVPEDNGVGRELAVAHAPLGAVANIQLLGALFEFLAEFSGELLIFECLRFFF